MDMHKDYLLDCEEVNRKPYSYLKYWRVVNSMNINFAKLGIEECETCDSFKIHREEIENQGDNVACVVRKKSRKTLKNDDLNVHGFCEQIVVFAIIITYTTKKQRRLGKSTL